MDFIIKGSYILLLGLIITFPFLILIRLKKVTRETFLPYILISLPLLAILVLIFAWWSHESIIILMSHYGYDFEPTNGPYDNVSEENIETVKILHKRMTGIGWPVKAIFQFVFLIPYLFFAYLANYIFYKIRNRNRDTVLRFKKQKIRFIV